MTTTKPDTPKSALRHLAVAVIDAWTAAFKSPWTVRFLVAFVCAILATATAWWGGPAAMDMLRSITGPAPDAPIEAPSTPDAQEPREIDAETPPVELSPVELDPAGADVEADVPPLDDPAVVGHPVAVPPEE